MHIGQAGPAVRVDLRGAAGDDDTDVRTFPGDAADRLAGLAFRLGGHGAGVDDHRACLSRRIGPERPRITSLS